MIGEILLYLILAFGPLAFGAVEPWSLAILEILIFLLFYHCAISGPRGQFNISDRTLIPAISTIICIGLVQRANPHPVTFPNCGMPFTASAYSTTQSIVLWCSFAALIWCVPRVLSHEDAYRRFPWALLIVGATIAVVGISQLGQGNPAYYGVRTIRQGSVFGPYTNHNHAASLMAMSFSVGLGLFISRIVQFRRIQGLGRSADFLAIQGLILFLLGVILVGVIMTGSRGGIHSLTLGSLCAGLVAMGLLPKHRAIPLLITGLLAIAATYATLLHFRPDLMGVDLKVLDESTKWRISMYSSGLQMYKDFPIWGTGLGAFSEAFFPYQDMLISGLVTHIHSDWLELLLETGTIGMVLIGALFFSHLWKALGKWRALESASQKALLLGGFGAAFTFLLHGFVDFNFQIPANAAMFLSVLAFLGTAPRHDTSQRLHPHIARRVLTLCFSLILVTLAIRPAIASWYTYRSDIAAPSSRPYYLNRAALWDGNPAHEISICRQYSDLAHDNPLARFVLYRKGVTACMNALATNPSKPGLRNFAALNLWNLNRLRDAADLK